MRKAVGEQYYLKWGWWAAVVSRTSSPEHCASSATIWIAAWQISQPSFFFPYFLDFPACFNIDTRANRQQPQYSKRNCQGQCFRRKETWAYHWAVSFICAPLHQWCKDSLFWCSGLSYLSLTHLRQSEWKPIWIVHLFNFALYHDAKLVSILSLHKWKWSCKQIKGDKSWLDIVCVVRTLKT